MFTSWEVVAGELSEFRKWRLVTRVVTVNSSTGVIMTLVCGHWSAMTLTTENDWLQCNVVTGVLTTETCHVTRDNVGVVLVMVLHWSKITDAETKLSVGEDEGRVALLLQHKNIINNGVVSDDISDVSSMTTPTTSTHQSCWAWRRSNNPKLTKVQKICILMLVELIMRW